MKNCRSRLAWKFGLLLAGPTLFTGACGDFAPDAAAPDDTYEAQTLAATTTAYEAESLTRTASSAGSKVTSESAASGGKYVEFSRTASTGAWIEFTLPNVAAGTYDLKFLYKSNTNRGIVQASVDGANQGATCNQYASRAAYKVACGLGTKALTAGSHKIRFTVTGKSSSSSGYQMVVDQISLTPSTNSAGCGLAPTLQTGNGQVMAVNGSMRSFNLRLPDTYDRNRAHRLVVAYHQLNGSATIVSDGGSYGKPWYGLWELSQGSTIFVAPQGINNAWANSGGADVEFTRQLIQKIANALCIDQSRIFAEGFSMGGSMAYAVACAMGDTVRGVAVHSGGPMSGCVAHTKPVAYFMTHGTKDSVTPFPNYGVPQLQDFAKMDGCTNPDPYLSTANFAAALPKPTSSAGACLSFTGCQAGYPVRSCLFVGDHTPTPGGVTSSWVPSETWQFISAI